MTLHLPGTIHLAATADQLYDDLAHALMAAAVKATTQRGVFHLALSGGATPEPFYVRLVIDPSYRLLPWSLTHLWLVDERRVPEDHEQSNFKMIRETLIDHVPIRKRQVHPMDGPHPDAASRYEALIRQHIPDQRLDFVLLGLGQDGHTASLFPHSPALERDDCLICVNDGPTVTLPERLTMTYRLLNAAREVAVLVTGQHKREVIRQVSNLIEASMPDPARWPITGIRPTDGHLNWYLDDHAADGGHSNPSEHS